MALGYIIFSIFIICQHLDAVPAVLKSIVDGALGIQPVAGGILGSTIMMGVKRGIFSNEAGQGSGAMVSAAAAVSHPARQGLAQAFSVYVDTLLVCTATALMILCSGTYNILDAKTGEMLVAQAPELGANYVGFTQAAVDSAFTGFGSAFVSIALVFFAFTTLMAYYFYTESSLIYLFSGRNGSQKTEKMLIWGYRFLLLVMVVFGSLREANVVWMLGDIGVGLTAWINVLALLFLCPHAIKALKEYEKSEKK
jgi:AGCS family alanine or glycine:cation symporter